MFPPRLKKEEWLSIANDFEQLWNFNHCSGAIDGKHVVIQVNIVIHTSTLLVINSVCDPSHGAGGT